MLLQIFAAFLALLAAVYFRIRRGISYRGSVPQFGKPGVLGYIQTAIRWTLDADNLINQGKAQFGDKPFAIPTLSGPVFFLPPRYLEKIRSGSDAVFSETMAVNEDLQLPFTMDAHQLNNPYQAKVLRTDVNRALPGFIPELLDESLLAMGDAFRVPPNQKSITFLAFDTMTHLIARISNRVIFGTELCRNEKFLHDVVRFAETTPAMAPFIQWSPVMLRPAVYFVLSRFLGGKREPLRIMVPWLEQYMKDREEMTEKPVEFPSLVVEYLIQSAPPQETIKGLAVRLLNINFGSIHTSSIFITQALFEIALLSEEVVESMRAEIREALASEGGWTKPALLKFRKVDSALREVGRRYGLMHFALPRFALVECDLGDGTYVPAGFKVAIDMTGVHFNPDVYSDPMRCDLFRFEKMRAEEDADTKYGFATVDSNYLPFGAGRHACAGRHFAATELKLMLAHMLLAYDIKFPAGVRNRPKNLLFNGAIVPDPKAQLVFTPRSPEKNLY